MGLAEAKAAIDAFLGTFAFVKSGGIGDLSKLSGKDGAQLMQELAWRALTRGRVDAIAASTPESWFTVGLNGVRLALPRYALMTMRHCISASADGRIDLMVETAHWERMRSELSEDTLFLDIGAATGAMCVPYAMQAKSSLRILAFEPSPRARSYLEATIARNAAPNITVLPLALSNEIGRFEFIEFPEDETGLEPYLPEGSHLETGDLTRVLAGQTSYPVDVTTLDALAGQLLLENARKLVIKIDVEGLEGKVLAGALATLKRFRPFLSIDIHMLTNGTTTDAACQAILTPLGYRIERIGHVMLGQPH
jgi:FkbM family methyltransferase